MASNDKTEKATQQRLRKARDQGQVVRSRDVSTAVGILVTLKVVIFLMPSYLDDFRHLFTGSFVPLDGQGALDNAWSEVFFSSVWLLVKMTLPLFIVPIAIIIGSTIPGGWVINPTHIRFNFARFNVVENLGRLFTAKHAVEVLTPIAKAVVLCIVLVYVTRNSVADYLQLQSRTFDQALYHGANLMIDGAMALCMVFVLFALLDLPIQTFIFLQGQRMTKQEVKEEYKDSEGRPEVKQRIRQLQRQLARRNVRKTVPSADAVIINPDHYSVAIKYDERRSDAPFVVAKGIDEMALYIREIAKLNEVSIISMPPLARAIYNTSQINQQIPVPLYKAVAQVLHYVLQLKAFQSGQRKAEPRLPDVSVPSQLT